jgi:hypothetical protein
MSSALSVIQEKAQRLSPQRQVEVIKLIEMLLLEEQAPATRGLTFDWADGPDDLPAPYDSVELQHQVLEWRIDERWNMSLLKKTI